MKYRVIINAFSAAYTVRIEEVNSFIEINKQDRRNSCNETAEAIVFYSDSSLETQLLENLPYRHIRLIKLRHYQPEIIVSLLTELEYQKSAELYIFTGDHAGRELAVRLSGRLKSSSLVAVEKIEMLNDNLLCSKKVYSGNLSGSFMLTKKPYCLSLARGMSRLKQFLPEVNKNICYLDYSEDQDESYPLQYEETEVIEEQQLEKAKFVIAIGRGAGSREAVSELHYLAQQLGAEMGVSRPVAMNSWAPLYRLLGASGAVISPHICLALAVSGSPPFYYGIEKSKHIIAVNTDADAPLVKAADLVIIEDYKLLLNALFKLVVEPDRA